MTSLPREIIQRQGVDGKYRLLLPEGCPARFIMLKIALVETANQDQGGDLYELLEWSPA